MQKKESKRLIGIKAPVSTANKVDVELKLAKARGYIEENGEYFEITLPFFQRHQKKMEIANDIFDKFERHRQVLGDLFFSMIEQYSEQAQLDNSQYQLELEEAHKKVDYFTNLFQERDQEYRRLEVQHKEALLEINKQQERILELEKENHAQKLVQRILKEKNFLLDEDEGQQKVN
jgi:hypothetical protein